MTRRCGMEKYHGGQGEQQSTDGQIPRNIKRTNIRYHRVRVTLNSEETGSGTQYSAHGMLRQSAGHQTEHYFASFPFQASPRRFHASSAARAARGAHCATSEPPPSQLIQKKLQIPCPKSFVTTLLPKPFSSKSAWAN